MADANERRRPPYWCFYVLIVGLMAWTIATRVDLFYARESAKEFRKLWLMEQVAHRDTILRKRVVGIEQRTLQAVEERDEAHDYETRLALVRRRFAGLVQPVVKAPPCPATAVVAPAPAPVATTRPDAAAGAEPEAVTVIRKDKATAEKLRKLQAWVREHHATWHGVTIP